MELAEVKRRLRRLKRIEIRLRFGSHDYKVMDEALVWSRFFSLGHHLGVKYPLKDLLLLDPASFKRVSDEYMAFVYSQIFEEMDFRTGVGYYDPHLLEVLGLGHDADSDAIKRRFRELAKEHHPDTGGSPEKFIELMEVYRTLMQE